MTSATYKPVTLLTDDSEATTDLDAEDGEEDDEDSVIYTRSSSSSYRALERRSVSGKDYLLLPRSGGIHSSDRRTRPDGVESMASKFSSSTTTTMNRASAGQQPRSNRCCPCSSFAENAKAICCGLLTALTERYLPSAALIVFFLLFAAFPVHFVDLVAVGIVTVKCLRLVYICFFASAIFSAILSPVIVTLLGDKWVVVCSCAGVSIFTLARFWTLTPLIIASSIFCGLTVGASLTAFRIQAMDTPKIASSALRGSMVFRSSSVLYLSLSGSAFISAILWLVMAPETITSVYPHGAHITPSWQLVIFANETQTSPPVPTYGQSGEGGIVAGKRNAHCGVDFQQADNSLGIVANISGYMDNNNEGMFSHRVQVLIGMYLVCSIGSLLLALGLLENSSVYHSFSSCPETDQEIARSRTSRVVLEVFRQFGNRYSCFIFVVATFLGSQQMFAYYIYRQAFPACYYNHETSVVVGLLMATVALVISLPLGYILPHTGRVKLLIPSYLLMASLVFVILFSEWMSHVPAIFIVGCLWSLCDCSLHIIFLGLIGIVFVDRSGCFERSMSIFSIGHLIGQFSMFLLHSLAFSTSSVAFILLLLMLAAICCQLATEISTRLTDKETKESLTRRQSIKLLQPEAVTWLPMSNPMQRRSKESDVNYPDDNRPLLRTQ